MKSLNDWIRYWESDKTVYTSAKIFAVVGAIGGLFVGFSIAGFGGAIVFAVIGAGIAFLVGMLLPQLLAYAPGWIILVASLGLVIFVIGSLWNVR